MLVNDFNYKWTLKGANFTKDKGKVFSTFACGGGSTMGYKLAGFDVLGCNEIDPKMAETYKANHDPKYCFIEDIRAFRLREDLPEELFDLDILDQSPPCSSYSMAGNREKDWGKEKVFREGQAKQTLDDLFFEAIALAKRLQPKVAVFENVKGILIGNAIKYVARILEELDEAGYYVNYYLLDASKMGVPQRRERVFFIAVRKDLADKYNLVENIGLFNDKKLKLDMKFNEKEVIYREIEDKEDEIFNMPKSVFRYWSLMNDKYGPLSLVHPKGSFFNEIKIDPNKVAPTITSGGRIYHHKIPRRLNTMEFCKIGTFPLDYNFMNNKPYYLIGMSVPPPNDS